MDGFTYSNIFETKGVEYLAIIAFFLLLVPFWILLNRQVKISKQIEKALGILTSSALKVPQGLFFSRLHTWTHLERSGVAKVGMDDLLLHITGEVSFNKLREPGEKVGKGDLMAEINHKGKILKIYSPISGEVIQANPILLEHPEVLNEDPYQKGWMYKVKPTSWIADTNSYFLAEEASDWSRQELERFKDFLAGSMDKYSPDNANVILQDGGEICDQPLSELPEEVWKEFQKDFLSSKTQCNNANCFRNLE